MSIFCNGFIAPSVDILVDVGAAIGRLSQIGDRYRLWILGGQWPPLRGRGYP